MSYIRDLCFDTFKLFTRPLSDESYLKLVYFIRMKKKLDLENPVTLNEKLQWLKLNNRNPKLNQLVDKYAVKGIVAETIGEEYIIPTLGVWRDFDSIDFSKLPDQFVLKCNHDSHSVVICNDKATFDYKAARKKLNSGLKKNYFWHGREWAYKDVKPLILAEKYMTNDGNLNELIDYKFYCFQDYVDCVLVCIDRELNDPKFYFFDKDWNLLRYNIRGKEAPVNFTLPEPPNMNLMFEIASKLSLMTGAPYVRVDLYNVDGHPYFGELTFTPDNGLDRNRLPEMDKYFGDLVDLSIINNG